MSNIKQAKEWHRLGITYFSQGRWAAAIEAYQAAIKLQPDLLEAYYNLGLAYSKLARHEEAINAYQAVIDLVPHAGARFQLASVLMRQHKYGLALPHFLLIEHEPLFRFEVLANLAVCYLKLGKLNEAKSYYMQCLELESRDAQVLFNLGVLSMQQGRTADAVRFYLQVVRLPIDEALLDTYYAAHNNLGAAYLAQKNHEAALLHFREALRIHPDQPAIHHLIHIIENKKMISASPPDYVRSLFNSYADHYEAHLVEDLHYQVPQLIYQMVRGMLPVEKKVHILDLGCGTGLCGQLFAADAARLVGVDISAGMLEIAAEKHIYHELIQADITSFLRESVDQYDIVIAGDVLPYMGSLDALMLAMIKVVKPSGRLIFSVEQGGQMPYEMTSSGRFIHRAQYIEQLIQENQGVLLQKQAVALRTQEGQGVLGYLYLVQKLS